MYPYEYTPNPYTPNYEVGDPRLTPVGCVGKFTMITLVTGNTFGMIVDSADPTGFTTGRVPPTMAKTAFPSSFIASSICV
ncbi:hypothetical protein [Bacillus cereus]|uniref:hypothetical protein n=1 Tax=Bacillus cereus TaxID=1396 RepID=UPI000279B3A9|nr:hypothetical protein [Bacillus cereus]EJR88143.1 hypothetical protein IKA_04129 [Bacillus cereus VD169]